MKNLLAVMGGVSMVASVAYGSYYLYTKNGSKSSKSKPKNMSTKA